MTIVWQRRNHFSQTITTQCQRAIQSSNGHDDNNDMLEYAERWL